MTHIFLEFKRTFRGVQSLDNTKVLPIGKSELRF